MQAWSGILKFYTKDKSLVDLIQCVVNDTMDSFKKRYLSSDKDIETLNDVSVFTIHGYIHDEFQHNLQRDKFEILLEELSVQDFDNLFIFICDALTFMIKDYSDVIVEYTDSNIDDDFDDENDIDEDGFDDLDDMDGLKI